MRTLSVILGFLVAVSAAFGQALSPLEIEDPAARNLQAQHLSELQSLGEEVRNHRYPYKFYLSRVLDLNEEQQRAADQSSIRFEKYGQQMALEITGNYYASYLAEKMSGNERARQTFNDVILPMLKIVVPRLESDEAIQAYAFEISHHVRRKVLRQNTEVAENLVVVLPRAAAQHLVAAHDDDGEQSALLESEEFLNGQRFDLWLSDDLSRQQMARQHSEPPKDKSNETASPSDTGGSVSSKLLKPPPVRLVTHQDLVQLNDRHADTIARMRQDLESQAHFVSYAPPAFTAFHQGIYLQLSMTSQLNASADGSRYHIAAFAFDDHISHLVRAVLAYFPEHSDFDGINFSTTAKVSADKSEAVEFVLPFSAMQCYATYDCTGQQLLDAGIVLINGERAALNLAAAEGIR